MKAIKETAMIFVVMFIASTCFAASAELPEKYNLDNQMQKVSEILKYNFMGWEKVDSQSFVLQTSPSDYYLIVLTSPSDHLVFSEAVGINATGDVVKPGYNTVFVKGNGFTDTCIINKIYKFKDYAQVKTIIAQITGERK
jgi:hypothetical protein